jgi:hypothetical protein
MTGILAHPIRVVGTASLPGSFVFLMSSSCGLITHPSLPAARLSPVAEVARRQFVW